VLLRGALLKIDSQAMLGRLSRLVLQSFRGASGEDEVERML
jgi:hypothetical protein